MTPTTQDPFGNIRQGMAGLGALAKPLDAAIPGAGSILSTMMQLNAMALPTYTNYTPINPYNSNQFGNVGYRNYGGELEGAINKYLYGGSQDTQLSKDAFKVNGNPGPDKNYRNVEGSPAMLTKDEVVAKRPNGENYVLSDNIKHPQTGKTLAEMGEQNKKRKKQAEERAKLGDSISKKTVQELDKQFEGLVEVNEQALAMINQVLDQSQAQAFLNGGKLPKGYKTGGTVDPEQSGEPIKHTVAKGDTLYALAKKYGVSYEQIAKDNNITNPRALQIGKSLTISKEADKMPTVNLPTYTVVSTQAKPGSDKYETLRALRDMTTGKYENIDPEYLSGDLFPAYAIWEKTGRPNIKETEGLERAHYSSKSNTTHIGKDLSSARKEMIRQEMMTVSMDDLNNVDIDNETPDEAYARAAKRVPPISKEDAETYDIIANRRRDFLAEAAHAYQWNVLPRNRTLMNLRAGMEKLKYGDSKSPEQRGTYGVPGTVEYEAHNTFEPQLKKMAYEDPKKNIKALSTKIDLPGYQFGGTSGLSNQPGYTKDGVIAPTRQTHNAILQQINSLAAQGISYDNIINSIDPLLLQRDQQQEMQAKVPQNMTDRNRSFVPGLMFGGASELPNQQPDPQQRLREMYDAHMLAVQGLNSLEGPIPTVTASRGIEPINLMPWTMSPMPTAQTQQPINLMPWQIGSNNGDAVPGTGYQASVPQGSAIPTVTLPKPSGTSKTGTPSNISYVPGTEQLTAGKKDFKGYGVKDFQDWAVKTYGKTALPKFGNDGKWGNETESAWNKYGREYLTAKGDFQNPAQALGSMWPTASVPTKSAARAKELSKGLADKQLAKNSGNDNTGNFGDFQKYLGDVMQGLAFAGQFGNIGSVQMESIPRMDNRQMDPAMYEEALRAARNSQMRNTAGSYTSNQAGQQAAYAQYLSQLTGTLQNVDSANKQLATQTQQYNNQAQVQEQTARLQALAAHDAAKQGIWGSFANAGMAMNEQYANQTGQAALASAYPLVYEGLMADMQEFLKKHNKKSN
jgi:LysM repeat protein